MPQCIRCKREISQYEFDARSGECQNCWGQIDVVEG